MSRDRPAFVQITLHTYIHKIWGKDLTYYLTSFFCLVNWDMHYPGSACRGTDLPSGRIFYIHTLHIIYIYIYNFLLLSYFIDFFRKNAETTLIIIIPLLFLLRLLLPLHLSHFSFFFSFSLFSFFSLFSSFLFNFWNHPRDLQPKCTWVICL